MTTAPLPEPRIVVITNGNYFARLILDDLFAARHGQIVSVLLIGGDYKGRTGLAAVRWLARVTTLPYLIYKIVSILVFSFARRIRRNGIYEVAQLARRWNVPTRSFVTICDEAAIAAVESERPDLIVSVSCPQLIPDRVLKAARLGGINIHSSLLPRFAGLAPYYWVLSEGESRTGTTVHFMTKKFDEGNVLGTAAVDILPRDSAFHLFRRLALAGGKLLADSVSRVLAGERGTPMATAGHTYRSHPDFRSYLRLRRRGHRLVRLGDLRRALQ
jgi:methionyl-tRNA formyltransferase